MFVKTDSVKERGNSIGMFSRNGKATALLHSIFRDRRPDTKVKKGLEDDYIALMLNPGAQKKEEDIKEKKTAEVPKESFFFRAVSREKAQPPKDKTPDALTYKPKPTALEPKTAFYATYHKKDHNRSFSVPEKPIPHCLHGGVTCDYKVRNLKQKLEKVRADINSSELDIIALHNGRLIDDKNFELFKDPGLTLLAKFSELTSHPDPGTLPNPTALVNLVVKYHSIKQQLEYTLLNNKDDIEHLQHNVIEKPRPKTSSITPFNLQLDRPPIVKKKEYNSDISLSFLTEGESPEVKDRKKVFWQNKLRKTHHFDSYTKRKLPFPYEHMKCLLFDADNFLKIKPRNQPYLEWEKMVPRKGAFDDRNLTNSVADKADMNNLFFKTFAGHSPIAHFGRVTGRDNHFMKKSHLKSPQKGRDLLNTSAQMTFYRVEKANDASFITPVVY